MKENEELERFTHIVKKCLHKAEASISDIEAGVKYKKQKGQLKKVFFYSAVFLYGPFNECKLTMHHEYFRAMTDDELVSSIFQRLASCSFFRFNFKKAQFEKPEVVYG